MSNMLYDVMRYYTVCGTGASRVRGDLRGVAGCLTLLNTVENSVYSGVDRTALKKTSGAHIVHIYMFYTTTTWPSFDSMVDSPH